MSSTSPTGISFQQVQRMDKQAAPGFLPLLATVIPRRPAGLRPGCTTELHTTADVTNQQGFSHFTDAEYHELHD
jgi:hypothetical protein